MREGQHFMNLLASIPVAFGALVFRVIRIFTDQRLIGDLNPFNLLVGFLAVAISGYLSINFMMNLIKKLNLNILLYFMCLV